MKHERIYNHLNAIEFLVVNRSKEWKQLLDAIEKINANSFLKISKDKVRRGEVLYNQVAINDEFKKLLANTGWSEMKREYYVSGDIPTAKRIVEIKDPNEQKKIIEDRQLTAYPTYNQVDFVKDRIAVEVQFGKYFSVAYDLHVKHTFFFLRDEIDVGVEIIPTHAMMRRMDTGVSWFENEVANVIREGRNNPSVPIVIIGIEPDDLIPAPKAEARAKKARKKADALAAKSALMDYKVREMKDDLSVMLEHKESLVTSVNMAYDADQENRTAKSQNKLLKAQAALSNFTPKFEAAEKKYEDLVQKSLALAAEKNAAVEFAVNAEEEGKQAALLKKRLAAKKG